MSDYTPFDFVASASHSKVDLIKTSDRPDEIEAQYVPFITNKGFSYHEDTVLHANEMNRMHHLPKDAQYRYYLSALRSRKRFSKWYKAEKDQDLDMIQEYYQCNRTVAKGYLKILTPESIKKINTKMDKGGS